MTGARGRFETGEALYRALIYTRSVQKIADLRGSELS
jgi:hypothetical protein